MFVPSVPPTEQRPISPQARELANRIGSVIEEYRSYYPQLSGRDVRDALRAVRSGETGVAGPRKALGLAFAGGVAALVGALFATGGPENMPDVQGMILPVTIAIGIVAIAIAFVVRNR